MVVAALGWPLAASAHIVKDDGTIEGLLHISPNDDPVAAQASTLGFSITDASGRFAATACDCRIAVKVDGKQKLGRTVAPSEVLSDGAVLVNYTFPYQGVYTIVLEGKPKQADGFSAFKLTYDVRVAQGPVKPDPWWTRWGLVALVVGAVGTAGYFVYGELSFSIGKKPKKKD
jgi:hypothetical protein